MMILEVLSPLLLLLLPAPAAAESSTGSVSVSIPIQAVYEPGKLDVVELDLHLSKGLHAKVIARAGEPVEYHDGQKSEDVFHELPDGAAVFENEETGGWVYVSNSEVDFGNGGVGGLYFDADGNIVEYKRLLTGTNRNCNGGKTAWNTWITCEEDMQALGKVYQVDPFGKREPVMIQHGNTGGAWEAFAHDTRNASYLHAFLTEDVENGALQRMTIPNPDYNNPWDILLTEDDTTVEYLVLEPQSYFDQTSGTFRWTDDEDEARDSAAEYYPRTEGMEMDGDILCFISKELNGFFHLALDNGTYTFESVGFTGQPDQSTTVYQQDGTKLVYFTEEAHPVMGLLGAQVGVYTRNEDGEYTNILFGSDYSSETTGIAFSPNGLHMYFAYQEVGILFEVTRTDGLSFFAPTAQPTGEDSLNPPEENGFLDLVEEGIETVEGWIDEWFG